MAFDTEEGYNQLFAFNPNLFNEVPLNQIASMLGMTAETLSRIQKNNRNTLLDLSQADRKN